MAAVSDYTGGCHDQGVLQNFKTCGAAQYSISSVADLCRLSKFYNLVAELAENFIKLVPLKAHIDMLKFG